MSHDATAWAIKAGNGLGLNATDKLVLWHLADCHNPVHGCFPSQDYLATACEVARSTINRSLDKLEQRGLFTRVARVHPVTRQQLPTRYVLAIEKAKKPQDVVSRVPGSDTGNRGPDGEEGCEEPVEDEVGRVPIGHGTIAEHGTLTFKETSTPLTPPEGEATFDLLISLWDPERRGNFAGAESAFRKLDPKDQQRAVALAGATRGGLWQLQRPLPTLTQYLTERAFAEFENPPPIEGGRFVITPDRPEWSGWLTHIRKTVGNRGVDSIKAGGRYLPATRFPPAGGLI